MATNDDDFYPITAAGEISLERGLRKLLGKQAPQIGVEPGTTVVFVTRAGGYIDDQSLTEGERYWSKLTSWLRVDTSPHVLYFTIPVVGADSRASFDADIGVTVSVSDSVEIAKSGIRGVRELILPELQTLIGRVKLTGKARQGAPPDLGVLRTQVSTDLSSLVNEQIPELPAGLRARIASINVTYEKATGSHVSTVVAKLRDGEIQEIEDERRQKQLNNDMQLRAAAREALGPHLADPNSRIFEAALADPTAANLLSAAQEANANDAQNLGAFVHMLELLLKHDYAQEGDPGYEALISLLNALTERANLPQLSGGSRRAQLKGATDAVPPLPEG